MSHERWLAPFLEATCDLDRTAEARAETAFVRRGGTLVVITHRIIWALRARKILFFDGPDTMLGTSEQLLIQHALDPDLAGHWVGSPGSGGGELQGLCDR